MTDDSRGGGFRDGMRQGLGVLTALKEAIEETISDARERGDLSPDRAREAVKDAMHRAQEFAGGAKDRLDFVPRREFDALREELRELRAELARRDAGGDTSGDGDGSEAGKASDPGPDGFPGPSL